MARTTAPLFSMDASGSIGKSIVFSRWKGRNYVRRHAIPSNPMSGLQVYMRSMFAFLTRGWAAIPGVSQATWDAPAEPDNISPFNAYVRYNGTRHYELKGPSMAYPAAELTGAPDAPTLVVTGGAHCATVVISEGIVAPNWGWMLFAKLAAAPTGIPTELVKAVDWLSPDTPVLVSPLPPGVWHFKALGFMIDGVLGALSADASDTVT